MIHIDLSTCTGCRRCETACAFFHTGRVNRNLARIKVLNLYEIGIDGPVLCQQCQERYCLKCPQDALSLGAHGQIVASPTVCTLCGVCEALCPIGAIELFGDFVYVCDLCGGQPKCVDACTEGALTWTPDAAESRSFKALQTETQKMTPRQKRERYLRAQGDKIREQWRKTDG